MFSFNCVWTDPLMIHAFLSTASLLSTEQRGRQSTIKILKISQTSMGKDRPCGNPREECHTSVRRRVERWRENGTTQRRQASLCRPQPREGQFLCLCLFKHMCDRGQCRSVMCCNENILWVQVWHFLKSKFETFTSSGVYGLWGIDVSGLFQFDQERFRCSSYLPSSKNSLPLGHWWAFRHEKAAVFTKCKELRCWKSFVQREQQINVIKSWKKTEC